MTTPDEPFHHSVGVQPFDPIRDHVIAASKLLYPTYTPFRRVHQLDPEQAARMEARRRETERTFEQRHAEWQRALAAAGDPRVRAGLELHEPRVIIGQITCRECSAYDQEGLSAPDWPCDTYEALTSDA